MTLPQPSVKELSFIGLTGVGILMLGYIAAISAELIILATLSAALGLIVMLLFYFTNRNKFSLVITLLLVIPIVALGVYGFSSHEQSMRDITVSTLEPFIGGVLIMLCGIGFVRMRQS